ncbi:MAG: NAD(P)H-quinone oxidoreductase [Clostridia bacterium]|nr:NAD(P)H-quinone oxidoreductase [Clostridia bacterium]
MKAILINDDRSLRWDDVPDPIIKSDEVLVRISATAINRADLLQREGKYPPPPGSPEWMGLEISGIIEAMGVEAQKNSRFKVGDKVCALLGGGGYAEYVAVRYDMLMPVPENCTMAEAASIPEAFATSYLNLFIEGGIRAGETLLVFAGGSGLASVMIPMAKSFGIRVITTVRSEEKAKKIAHLNADRVIVTEREDITLALKEELDNGHPVDVAIDCVGGEGMGKCLPYLARGARWIMIAALAGSITEIDLRTVYVRNIRIIGSTLRSRAPEVKAQILAGIVRDVYPKIETGEVKPTIYKVLPITEAEEAQAILYRNENVGKGYDGEWARKRATMIAM